MQNLTGKFSARLVPSSMSAGNTQADPGSYKLAMTAPGSPSILPPSPTTDNLLDLGASNSDPIPVSHPGMQERVQVQSARAGSIPWRDAHDIPGDGQGWKETS